MRVALLVLVTGLAVLLFWWKAPNTGEAEAPRQMGPGGPLPVQATRVESREIQDRKRAIGNARALESVMITANVSEVIEEIHFREGQSVEKGAVLVVLEQAEERAELAAAQARLREHERELKRLKTLMARNVAARREYDERTTEREVTRAEIKEIEARIEDRVIRAPFAGVVGQRDLSPGALVRPGDPVTTLDDLSRIRVEFTAPALFLSGLKLGIPVLARTDAFPGQKFAGRVDFVGTRVDPGTRSVRLRAEVDNPKGQIIPGMLMYLEMTTGLRESLLVPEESVIQRGREHSLMVIDMESQQAIQRSVQIGTRFPGEVEIRAGLEPGAQVITRGVDKVRPGQSVRILGPENTGSDSSP